MTSKEYRPGGNRPVKESSDSHTTTALTFQCSAQSVSWWSVHEFVQPYLDTAGPYPAAGTPAWSELADGDRRKWAALLDYAQHHALRVEIAQEQHAEAAHAISGAADWGSIAREIRNHNDVYIPRSAA